MLYDAIYQAADNKLNQETGRKALIILTDGEDEGSEHKIKDAIAAAERNNIIIYVILIADREMYWSQGEGYYGYSPAKQISDESGGRIIDVGNNGAKLQAAFQQIEAELRTQYVASYTPSERQGGRNIPPHRAGMPRRQWRRSQSAGAQGILRSVAGELEADSA